MLIFLILLAAVDAGQITDGGTADMSLSNKFHADLRTYFSALGSPAELGAVLELGTFLGRTTLLLSELFQKVFAVDISRRYLERSAARAANRSNVIYLKMDAYVDAWAAALGTAGNRVRVVLIDAWHDYASVGSDLGSALSMPSVQRIILDDWSASEGVRRTVQEAVEAERLLLEQFVGEGQEGVVCRVLRPGEGGPGFKSSVKYLSSVAVTAWLQDTSWLVYGLPVDAHFRAAGGIRFSANGGLSTTWGAGAWQPLGDSVDSIVRLAIALPIDASWPALPVSLKSATNDGSNAAPGSPESGANTFLIAEIDDDGALMVVLRLDSDSDLTEAKSGQAVAIAMRQRDVAGPFRAALRRLNQRAFAGNFIEL